MGNILVLENAQKLRNPRANQEVLEIDVDVREKIEKLSADDWELYSQLKPK